MQEPNEGGEIQSPQDRSEVTTGAARLGAALLNTSTDPLTQIPEAPNRVLRSILGSLQYDRL